MLLLNPLPHYMCMQLFRDCLRLADYISTRVRVVTSPTIKRWGRFTAAHGSAPHFAGDPATECMQGGNRKVLRDHVKESFRRNLNETDPVKIEEQKQA